MRRLGEETPERFDGYVTSPLPAQLAIYDRATKKLTPWRSVMPADASGIAHIDNVLVTPDGTAYAYSYLRDVGTLYEIDGVR